MLTEAREAALAADPAERAPARAQIAYLSMEIALESGIPTYSGGLGVLAGDTLRACADLGISICGVTLAHRRGYFRQGLDAEGRQHSEPEPWQPEQRLQRLGPQVTVEIGGRAVALCAWLYHVRGVGGHDVPVFLLDADLPENADEDRALTHHLYGGGDGYRLAQEILLGIGGMRMLRALGQDQLRRFHLNEGHAALALAEIAAGTDENAQEEPLDRCRRQVVFTTHTPVPAGHDRFPAGLVRSLLDGRTREQLRALGQTAALDMTQLALAGAGFVNGVARRHAEVSREMFPEREIHAITNGIHPATWAAPSFAEVFDRHMPGWRQDPFQLRGVLMLDAAELATAHRQAKRALMQVVKERTGRELQPDALTLGFARRATAYKRAGLILRDLERLAAVAEQAGPLQLVFAGKAHPDDREGQEQIRSVHEAAARTPASVEIVFLPGYDMSLAATLIAGSDVWLNTPIPPLEASGTSGMKAALNGVPSLSVLDGWWLEGCVEGVTGWAIDADGSAADLGDEERDSRHADALYRKLGQVVAPTWYARPDAFHAIMRNAIALNASHFHTHRMAQEYLFEAYRGVASRGPGRDGSGGG